jgi:DNA-binding transcriptional MocR family regulator
MHSLSENLCTAKRRVSDKVSPTNKIKELVIDMKAYSDMSKEELRALREQLEEQFKEEKAKGLSLNMSRGKPGSEQLNLSLPMLDIINSSTDMRTLLGNDTRNYGDLDGIGECRKLMADMLGVQKDNVIVCGNSSLNIMYDTVSRSMVLGVNGATPWCKLDKVKFLCPVPGYDRHFKITETFGIEMINIPLLSDGPDMDMVEEYVNNDPAVKGIWCVPLYSNPTGTSYSDEVVRRFANLKPAAEDFRIYWDNAYGIHHLYEDDQDSILNILDECEKAGNPNMVYIFASTSKITFPGAGISVVASSLENIQYIMKCMTVQTIGYDKINELRHARFLKDYNGLKEHMRLHADIIRPKFEAVLNTLETELGGAGIGTWTKPKGGYFISFNSLPGCAKDIVAKCKELGVVLTNAGATYPYGKDSEDSNIRIAPTFPTKEEMGEAAKIFALCVKLSSVEKLLQE